MLGGQKMIDIPDGHGVFSGNSCCVISKHKGMTWHPFIKEETM